MKILYADPDQDCREFVTFVLRGEGYTVYEAINGAQAVQISREEPLDFVILNSRLPLLTGYVTARMISTEIPHLPVAFFTAQGLYDERKAAFAAGDTVVDYLVKPQSATDLVAWVENILHRRQNIPLMRETNMARVQIV